MLMLQLASAAAEGNLWTQVSGSSAMNFGDALRVSLVGFAIVFLVLGFLAAFVFCMGKVFEAIQKNKEKKAPAVAALSEESAAYTPADTGLNLVNTTEEEAAVIMAITSDMTKIPLNRLKFNSIKLLEDDKK